MSILDVAKAAGVGVGTVSRYINNREKVSAETARRVQAAIERTGYVARTRRPGPKTADRKGVSTGVVQVLLFTRFSPQELQGMAVFPRLLSGIQNLLLQHKMTLMVNYCHSGDRVPEMLDRRFCDGVIAIMMGRDVVIGEALLAKLEELPRVWCFREYADPNLWADHILFNNHVVGGMAAEYLHRRGHSRVVLLNEFLAHDACDERERCFCEACRSLGMDCHVLRPAGSDARPGVYSRLAEAYLALAPRPTGAFFCIDDTMLGVGMALGEMNQGYQDLDLLGCNNDQRFMGFFPKRPASIDIRLDEMGQLAVTTLMARINGTKHGRPVEIALEPRLCHN